MALIYDLEKDLRYKQGFAIGFEQGLQMVGAEKKVKKMVIVFLKQGILSVEQIAEVAEIPLSYIEKIAAELKELGNLT